MEDKDISLPTWARYLLVFIVGISIGIFGASFINSHMENKTPAEIADYLEEMLFAKQHLEDIIHRQGQALLSRDDTTIGEIKRWYLIYNGTPGISRNLLEMQINKICFKKDFKW